MPTRLNEIGGKLTRVALPVVAVGSLCTAAAIENQPNKSQVAAAETPHQTNPDITPVGRYAILLELREDAKTNPIFNVLIKQFDSAPTPDLKPQVPPKPAAPTTYTVQPGDSFSLIADKEHVDIFNLINDNHMKPWETLVSGKVLALPKPGEAPAPPEPLSPPVELVSYQAGATAVASQNLSSNTQAYNVAPAAPVSGGSSLLWRIAGCESGSGPNSAPDYTAENSSSGASGAWQDEDGTWKGYGGYSKAMYAPPSVQLAFNENLLASSGTSPWDASKSCWG